jgi:hypothetical protein
MQVRCDFAILSSLVVLFLLHVVSLSAANALCWLLCFFGMARLTTYSRALGPGSGEREHVCARVHGHSKLHVDNMVSLEIKADAAQLGFHLNGLSREANDRSSSVM